MVTKSRCLLVTSVVLTLFACEKAKHEVRPLDVNNAMTYETVDAEVMDKIVERLEIERIEFVRDGDKKIFYAASDDFRMQAVLVSVVTDDLPADRSISFSEHRVMERFRSRLMSSGVKFETKVRHGETWVVWEKEKEKEGREIADEFERLIRTERRDD